MKIYKLGAPTVIMSHPYGKANYFGWPSVTRLQNGKIAVVASGYRYGHICPFGKAVISYSEDEGNTYTIPAPVIDTPLDDRDAGIVAFGKSNVMVTSFNNSVQFQRESAGLYLSTGDDPQVMMRFFEKYLDGISVEDEQQYLGSEFRISDDCGVTFGKLYKSPVTSPHGPCVLANGTVLWVGTLFGADPADICTYQMNRDGSYEYVGTIPRILWKGKPLMLCEPYALQLPDGKILCHIRGQRWENGRCVCFATYQSESLDDGKTWSEPHRITDVLGGAPSHLMYHSSGMVIATCGHREKPYGIQAMFSKDGGNTWNTGHNLYINAVNSDLGYPCSIELKDGSILTVFYAHQKENDPAVILQQKWTFEE